MSTDCSQLSSWHTFLRRFAKRPISETISKMWMIRRCFLFQCGKASEIIGGSNPGTEWRTKAQEFLTDPIHYTVGSRTTRQYIKGEFSFASQLLSQLVAFIASPFSTPELLPFIMWPLFGTKNFFPSLLSTIQIPSVSPLGR